jgi:circadian clock protein KaiC
MAGVTDSESAQPSGIAARAADPPQASPRNLAATGVKGLDEVLGGGLTRERLYLIEGPPGAGKTTIALQFLLEGTRLGESGLYITLSETHQELRSVAASHGWSLASAHIFEVMPNQDALRGDQQYTVFHPAEVELTGTTRAIREIVDRVKPSRVVFDSLSELRLLAGSTLRYRRQVLALKQFLAERGCTVLVLDDSSGPEQELHVQTLAHGIIVLEHCQPEYGNERRRLRVLKYRAASYSGGYHDFVIRRGGVTVFRRLVAAEQRGAVVLEKLASGVRGIDDLMGGGIERGTSTLIAGAAGAGKSTLAAQFVLAAAKRGQRAAMFLFDESVTTLVTRCAGLGIDLEPYMDDGRITTRQIDPAELCPGELIHAVAAAAQRGAAVIVIDSLNGYLNALPEERFLLIQMHELLTYLGEHSVATLLVGAQRGIIGANMQTPGDASYLADAVVLLRYFEARGEVHQAISVVKKRGGAHERSIREFRLSAAGIEVGEPLRHFRGVLTGTPVFEGGEALMKGRS